MSLKQEKSNTSLDPKLFAILEDTAKYYISQVNNNQSDQCHMLGYTFRHQLFVYSCDSCPFIFIHVVMQLSFSSVVYHVIQLSCYYFMRIVYVHEFFSLHTHSPGHFLTTLNLHVQILDALFLLCRCLMRPYASRRAGASPYLIPVFLSFLPSYYFLILVISDSVFIPVFIYMISCVDAYM